MSNNNPIGVFDSGVGGLTVAKEIMRQLPNEKIIYLGDNARCPYGPRPMEEIKQYTWEMVRFLLQKNIKMLIIACNTATAAALDELKDQLDIPVIGVIYPGARAAIEESRNLHIGVIGTVGAIASGAYENALTNIHSGVKVTSLACPKFVPIVESGEWGSPIAERVVKEGLAPLKGTGIDTLVLGCTHYPFLEKVISKELGLGVSIISSGEETARDASTILQFNEMQSPNKSAPSHEFYTTGSRRMFNRIAVELFGTEIDNIERIQTSED
ncbi:MAG: glutamate racemase [Bacillales bacterium]|jgi:glutamate racemase|nr:glutamate racemase [Bacillales bacterium]